MSTACITLRSLLAALLITLPGLQTQAAPAKTANNTAPKTVPAKPAAVKQAAKASANKQTTTKTVAKPTSKKSAAPTKTANKAAKTANNTTPKTAPAKPAAVKQAAKASANKQTTTKTVAKPTSKKPAAPAKTANKAASKKNTTTAKTAPANKNNPCVQKRAALFSAVREGRIDTLEQYRNKKCPFNITDTRGLTLYDHTALNGRKNIADWLLKNKLAKSGQYSSAFYKHLQNGLRLLGHDPGPANGKLTPATIKAIKAFQKANKSAITGKPDIAWLPIFSQQTNKKIQQKLRALGYDTGGSNGIIGAKTRNAIQEYRQKNKLGKSAAIDDQLISQLLGGGKKDSKTTTKNGQRQEKVPKPVPVADSGHDAEQRATEQAEQQQAEAIARRQAEENRRIAQHPLLQPVPQPISVITRGATEQATAMQAREAAERSRPAAKEAARQENEHVRFHTKAPRHITETAQNQRSSGSSTLRFATPAVATPATTAVSGRPRGKTSFKRVSGSLNMSGNGSLVNNCNIGGQNIDPGWCQQYYPDSSGKSCNAVISGSGSVVSLTCK